MDMQRKMCAVLQIFYNPDKQMLFDYYLASNKILHALCDQKKLLEQMTKHVSGI